MLYPTTLGCTCMAMNDLWRKKRKRLMMRLLSYLEKPKVYRPKPGPGFNRCMLENTSDLFSLSAFGFGYNTSTVLHRPFYEIEFCIEMCLLFS